MVVSHHDDESEGSPFLMPVRIVLLKMGEHTLSLPFEHVDEILGADRAVAGNNLPEGVATGDDSEEWWVPSRGKWLRIREFLPEIERVRNSQIVVITCEGANLAFFVDQVLGIETTSPSYPFPESARPFTDFPVSGVRFLKGRPVLELDLSRLISLDRRDDEGE